MATIQTIQMGIPVARIEIVDLGGVSPADIVVQMGSQQDFQRFRRKSLGEALPRHAAL